jgi:hypothetical protein
MNTIHKSMLRTLACNLLIVFVALNLSACQSVGDMLWSMLPTPDPSTYGFAAGSTPVVGISGIPTARPPASIYEELIVGDMAISVRRVERPATSLVGKGQYTQPRDDEEYLLVEVQVYCLPDAEPCRITEFDFGVSSDSGRDYSPQFSSSFSGAEGLFEGGDIEPDHSLHGDIAFIVRKDATGLILFYPRMYPPLGESARFLLDQ